MMGDDAPKPPPGWYADPGTLGTQRYWDGSAWAAPPPPAPPAELATVSHEALPPLAASQHSADHRPDVLNRLAAQSSVFWCGVLACVLMVAGGLGTWATALSIVSVPGTRGDGWFVVGAGVAGVCALWANAMDRRSSEVFAAIVFGGVGAAASGIDLHKLAGIGATSFFGQTVQLVHPAWGIYLALGASVALMSLAVVLLVLGPDANAGEGHASNAPIIVVTLLLAVGTVVVVSNVGAPSGTGSSEASANTTSTASEPASAATTTATATTPSAPAVSSQQVQQTLDEYAAAYSAESTQRLSSLLASTLERRNGTHAPEGLRQALSTYSTQFSQLQHPSYTLAEPQITPEAGSATAKATYSITSQNGTVGGTITFHLVSRGSGLAIDRITTEPRP
jgi:hypothetical protein